MENNQIREEAKAKVDSEQGGEILRQRKSIPNPVWGKYLSTGRMETDALARRR